MYRNLFSVGAFTLLSRITGFLRDVVLGAVLGAGALADAFYIAFRLPNHFRAIFGEGAFNAAFVPSYSRVLETQGMSRAKLFSGQILTLLLMSQVVLLALAWIFTAELVALLAPGLTQDAGQMSAAVTMTRITFPYLLFITLVTLLSGVLNANGKFAAAAFAPVLLNLVMVGFLGIAFLFPDAGVAASFGILTAGILEFLLLVFAARAAGVFGRIARPGWTADVKQFFTALGPAVIGSAGVQIALFADTIIGSLLPTGGISSIYYADRIYQLPIGVIGIAAGTVLLPEMSRRLAGGDADGAFQAQNRTMALTIALSAPFFVAFTTIPHLIMTGVFQRGNFSPEAAAAAARVLGAYGYGLLAIVLIRSAIASFQSQGDTRTPMIVSLTAVAANVALKIVLFQPLGAVGLAAATAAGAWINFGLLVVLAMRSGSMRPDSLLKRVIVATALASVCLATVALLGAGPAGQAADAFGALRSEAQLALLGLAGAVVYGVALFGFLRALGVRPGRLKPLPRRTPADATPADATPAPQPPPD
ncbi:MAG: integral rane protein MviN [Hyphomicrobiales bacterium]|nr:integral rane protein MviN [Hyphomicrobiales bacterium]